MQETFANIQNDSTMMLIAGIAIVVLLAIVLVVVVSAMRIRAYKDRFQNLLIEIKEKSEYIKTLEKEAEASSKEHANNKKELSLFDETKKRLKKEKSNYKALDIAFKSNQKELDKARGTLGATKIKLEALIREHDDLKEEQETSLEENSKLRANNGRLLIKLEKEVAKVLQDQGKK